MAQSWRLEEAKARFSEVVRRAREEGPQAVTVRGRRAVVIVDAEAFDGMAVDRPVQSLIDFLANLPLEAVDVERPADTGREPTL